MTKEELLYAIEHGEIPNCVLVVETQSGKEYEFKCSIDTTYVDFPKSYDDDEGYQKFWEYHHPGTNHPGMSDSDYDLFHKLYDSDKIATMYYDSWLK